jgi:cytochrome P450
VYRRSAANSATEELRPDDDESLIIDGHVISPVTQVGVNTYSIHHNEECFPNPYEFRPERWLHSETPAEQLKIMRKAFVPFSMGQRDFIGKTMAYLESSLVIAQVIWHFDFQLPL